MKRSLISAAWRAADFAAHLAAVLILAGLFARWFWRF